MGIFCFKVLCPCTKVTRNNSATSPLLHVLCLLIIMTESCWDLFELDKVRSISGSTEKLIRGKENELCVRHACSAISHKLCDFHDVTNKLIWKKHLFFQNWLLWFLFDFLGTADALVSTGLAALGYKYVNIGMCYILCRGPFLFGQIYIFNVFNMVTINI